MGADDEGIGEGREPDPPAGWTPADEELRRRVIRDEIRIAHDEERIDEEERWIRRNWRLALALGGLLALTIAALVVGLVALNRDIDAVAGATPSDGSVGTAALQDRAVVASKLADAAVTGRAVAANALQGGQIDESSLAAVPRATQADRAATASSADKAATAADASALGGVAAAQYLRQVDVVRRETQASTLAVKGPVTATCPEGSIATGGGASIDGAAQVAITTSAPDGDRGWVAEAAAIGTPSAPWKIIVTAICARGGG